LFNEVDESGDGDVSWDEFSAVLTNCKLPTWFAAMEVDPSELEFLFEMLDDGDGQIGKDEFISAIKEDERWFEGYGHHRTTSRDQ